MLRFHPSQDPFVFRFAGRQTGTRSSYLRWLCGAFAFLGILGSGSAYAQYCGTYGLVAGWQGNFAQSASGSGTSGTVTYTSVISASADLALAPISVSGQSNSSLCASPGATIFWYILGPSVGGPFSNSVASIQTVQETYPCGTGATGTTSATGSGMSFEAPPLSAAVLTMNFATGQYFLYAAPTAGPVTVTATGCSSPVTAPPADFAFYYPPSPGFTSSPYHVTIPTGVASLTASGIGFQANVAPMPTSLNGSWTMGFTLTPLWNDESDHHCKMHGGSARACENQAIGEDVAVIGTGMHLHYQSDRVLGRVGSLPSAVSQARMIGGWTLNVHHVLDVGTGKLFLGSGAMRSPWALGTPVTSGSNLLVTSEDGSEVYVFGSTGRHLQTLTPLLGAIIYAFGYDASGNLVTVTDGSGNVTTIARDPLGHATAMTAPYGQVTGLALDANGHLAAVTDPFGAKASFSYDGNGLLLSRSDPNGFLYSYAFDGAGRLTGETDPRGDSTTASRADSILLETTIGSPPPNFTVTEHTPMGRTTAFKVDLLPKSGDGGGESGTVTWPNGLTPTFSRTQQSGQIVQSVTLPDGTADSVTNGPDPRFGLQMPVLVSATHTRGTRIVSVTGSRTASVSVSGNPFSLVSQNDTVTTNGRTYTAAFTAATRTLVSTTPMGRKVTTVVDALERHSSIQLATLAPVQFTYDSLGRLTQTAQASRTSSLAYDSSGFLASSTDAMGRTTSYARDADGRVVSTTLADGRVIEYAYDANGNRTSITPPGKAAHHFTFTKVNQLASYTPPQVAGSGPTLYTFNADRDVTLVSPPDNLHIAYSYDSSGRLSSNTLPTETRRYKYSATTGNVTGVTSTSGEALVFGYNGPLLNSTAWSGTVAGRTGVSYDGNLWVSSQSINGANSTSFFHNADGLLTGAGAMHLTYSNAALRTGSALGSLTDSLSYNGFGELHRYSAAYGATSLYDVTYTRDALGRVVASSETIGGVTSSYAYAYDATGRLTSFTANGVRSRYTYDSNSNRTSVITPTATVSATYDAQDRLQSYGTATYAFDANGRLASKTDGSQVTTYTYDAPGNLMGVGLPGGTQINYVIDPQDRRIGRKVNGVLTTGYLYLNDRVVAQLDASNSLVSEFVYAGGSGSPDIMISGGKTYRIVSDELGSPRLVVDTATGAVAQRMDYDVFGNVINDTSPGFTPFGFAGGLYDPDTALVRFGARDYSAAEARWTGKDPVLFLTGRTNLYGYAGDDPVNAVDPSGLADGDCQKCKNKSATDAPRKLDLAPLNLPTTPGHLDTKAPAPTAHDPGGDAVSVLKGHESGTDPVDRPASFPDSPTPDDSLPNMKGGSVGVTTDATLGITGGAGVGQAVPPVVEVGSRLIHKIQEVINKQKTKSDAPKCEAK